MRGSRTHPLIIAAALAGTGCAAVSELWWSRLGAPMPVEPAVGVALAFGLVLGWRGVIVTAAAFGGCSALIASGQGAALDASAMAAAVRAALLTLQALAGMRLLGLAQRHLPRLSSASELGCLVLAALATALLAFAVEALGLFADSKGLPGPAACAWGVLLGTPIALAWIGRPRRFWRSRRLLIGAVLPAVVLAAGWASVQYRSVEEARARARFEHTALEASSALTSQLQGATDALAALRSLHTASPDIDRATFEAAVAPWAHRHDLQALGLSRRLAAADLPAFEAQLAADGATVARVRSAVGDGSLRPLREGEGIVAIRLIAPWQGNAQVLGMNSYANPFVRPAIDRAIDTGEPAATPAFPLLLSKPEAPPAKLPAGSVIYQALYRGAPQTTAQRREATVGVAFVTLRIDRVAAGLAQHLPAGMVFCLTDAAGDPDEPLASSSGSACRDQPSHAALRVPVEFAQRQWTLALSAPLASQGVAWFESLSMGTASMLGLLLLSITGQTLVVRQAATRARRAQQAAERADRAKGAFLGRMSHELRTPLNAILGYTQLQQTTAAPSATVLQAWSARIAQAGWHLRDMIDDLLDTSLAETEQLRVNSKAVSLPPLIDAAIGMVAPQAEAARLQLHNSSDLDQAPQVQADPQRVRQILVNLLSNAIKYNRAGGSVEVETAVEAARLIVRVRDSGIGMSEQQLQLLFRPFERLGRSDSDVEGTGIGLYLSRLLAQQMGGSLTATSRAGLGSVFTLELPRTEQTPPAATAPAGITDSGAASIASVVAFEDDEVAAELLRHLFGRRTDIAFDCRAFGANATAWVRERQAQIILLDLHLADMDGLEVLAVLKAQPDLAPIPVILTSARTGAAAEFAPGTFAHTCPKPWDLVDLQMMVEALLNRSKPGVPA